MFRIRSLRARLTIYATVVFTVVQVVLCLSLVQVRESSLWDDLDQRLTDRAESILEAIRLEAEGMSIALPSDDLGPALHPFRFPGYYFQVVSTKGEVLARSDSLGEASLPFDQPARAARSATGPVRETVRGDAARRIADGSAELRMLTLRQEPPGAAPYFLQVATSTVRAHASIAELKRVLYVLVAAGTLAVGLVSWRVTRRALGPLVRLSQQAGTYGTADLTQRVEVSPRQDEVTHLAEVMNATFDHLEAAFRAQERFIADASHELKTPLAVVLARADVLRRQSRSIDEYDRFVSTVQQELMQLVNLVESLLTLARTDAGLPLKPTRVLLNEIVIDAVERCQALARHREIRVIPTLAMADENGREAVVAGEPPLLRALAENLLRNAIRYSPVEEAVEIEARLNEDDVSLTIRDRGPGIAPENLERIFERFFRLPRSEEWGEGCGLGLAIAKGIAELHGGWISVANRSGGGAEFTVRLPLATPGTDTPGRD
jgi:two-component system OmpR family sensor kinase